MIEPLLLFAAVPGEVAGVVGGAAATGIGALWRALSVERARGDASLRESLNAIRDATESNRLQNDLLQRQSEKLDELVAYVRRTG